MRKRQQAPRLPDLASAIALHRDGRVDEAERLYRALLAREPNNADALHFFGLLTHQRGDTAAAIKLVRSATIRSPDNPDAFNNLGNLLRIAGRFDEAEAAYRRSIALRPRDADAHSNLGAVLKARGDLVAAEAELATAIEIDERHVPALSNMGRLLTRMGRHDEAIAHHYAAVAFDPKNPDAPRVLGLAYHLNGEHEKAKAVFRDWLAREPGNAVAAHMLAACSSEHTPERARDDYVRTIFDGMAGTFDESLADLDYQGPRLIAEAFARAWPVARAELDVLDAGCGTGLCGPFLREYSRMLVGVDLSAGMLERAARRALYDTLYNEELTRFLHAHQNAYDAIVSADTLIYFGSLSEVFHAAIRALAAGGRLLFTLEQAADASTAIGYRLETHGRYSHERAYVASQLSAAGFEVEAIDTAILRMEAKVPVDGVVVTARSPTV